MTGAIAQFETEQDAREAGYTTPLTPAEASRLRGLPRGVRVEAHAAGEPPRQMAPGQTLTGLREKKRRARRERAWQRAKARRSR